MLRIGFFRQRIQNVLYVTAITLHDFIEGGGSGVTDTGVGDKLRFIVAEGEHFNSLRPLRIFRQVVGQEVGGTGAGGEVTARMSQRAITSGKVQIDAEFPGGQLLFGGGVGDHDVATVDVLNGFGRGVRNGGHAPGISSFAIFFREGGYVTGIERNAGVEPIVKRARHGRRIRGWGTLR